MIDPALGDTFRRDGFAVVGDVLPVHERHRLRDMFDDLLARRTAVDRDHFRDLVAVDAEGTGLLQIIGAEKYVPGFLELPHAERCRVIAAELLGSPAEGLDVFVHLIAKLRETGPETPWHQDEAYMDPQWERRGVSVWIPLDGATVEEGCLHFIAGSHRHPVREHRHVRSTAPALMTDEVDAGAATPCPLRPGDASVHDFRTLHYAGPNLTTQVRRAYVLVFTTPALPAANPEPRPWLWND
jgi:hypothetical protein